MRLEKSEDSLEEMESHSHPSMQSTSRPASMSSQRETTSLSQSLISLNGAVLNRKLSIPGEIRKKINSVIGSSGESSSKSLSINNLPSSSVEQIKRLKIDLYKNSVEASTRAKVFTEATMKIEKRQRTLSGRSSRSDILSSESPKAPSQGEFVGKMYHQKNSNESCKEIGHQISDHKAGNRLLSRHMRNPVTETEKMSISVQRATGVMDRNKEISISANTGPIQSEENIQTLQWGKTKMKKRSVIKSENTVNRNLNTPDGIRVPKRGTQQTLVGSERQRGNNYDCRPSGIEEDCVASPMSSTRLNTPARGPRTKTGSLSKASWNISQSLRDADESDPHQIIKKVKSSGGATSHKNSADGQWAAQKPPKSQGARRPNLSSVIPILDRAPASGGLSENREPGVFVNKAKFKDKSKKRKIEETGARTLQIADTMLLPLKKSKLVGEEEVKDVVQSRGKNRQVLFQKPRVPGLDEKIENSPTSALKRSAKVGYVKVGSKPGRQTIKKVLESRGQTCLKNAQDSPSTEFSGQSIDDHNILIAAANAAADTRRLYSGEIWKRFEPFFHFLCSDDIAFLHEQTQSDEPNSSCQQGGDGQDFKGNTKHISVSPIPTSRDSYSSVTNKTNLQDGKDPFIEQLAKEVRKGRGVSICQALLSAIIEEDDLSNVDYSIMEDDLDFSDSSKGYFEDEADIASDGLNLQSMMLHDSDRGSTKGFKINAPFRCHEADGVHLNGSNLFTEAEYNQMCIDDRILLELSEIGIYPDPVPDLAQSEDEDVREGINILEGNLYEKIEQKMFCKYEKSFTSLLYKYLEVSKKKAILLRLEKNVSTAREREQKEFEQIALDKLVVMAYEKYLAYWGTRASSSNNVTNNMKHAAISFIKQTLARYREFKESGISCFAEPAFRNIFLSSSSKCSDEIDKDAILNGEAAKKLTTAPHPQNYLTGFSRRLASNTKIHEQEKCLDDVPERTHSEGQPRSSRVKLLDDVALGSAWKDSTFGSSLGGGTKRKRSARDRDLKAQSKDAILVTRTAKNSQPSPSNSKGKGRNKTKSKQKKTQISSSVDSLPSKTSNELFDSTPKSNPQEANDLSNFQLPDTDDGGFAGQDIDTWLNINEEGMQDLDFVGLEIPMDDLRDINLLM